MTALPQMSSAQLRIFYEGLPDGYCKEFVRGRADTLLRSGQSMTTAMQTAIVESIDYFPEVHLLLRGHLPRPFDDSDRQVALLVAETAIQLRTDFIALRDTLEPMRTDYIALRDDNTALRQVVDGYQLSERLHRTGSAYAAEEAVLEGKGKGKGKAAADFRPFSGKGHRLDGM
jgi:hypothetical protein